MTLASSSSGLPLRPWMMTSSPSRCLASAGFGSVSGVVPRTWCRKSRDISGSLSSTSGSSIGIAARAIGGGSRAARRPCQKGAQRVRRGHSHITYPSSKCTACSATLGSSPNVSFMIPLQRACSGREPVCEKLLTKRAGACFRQRCRPGRWGTPRRGGRAPMAPRKKGRRLSPPRLRRIKCSSRGDESLSKATRPPSCPPAAPCSRRRILGTRGPPTTADPPSDHPCRRLGRALSCHRCPRSVASRQWG